MKSISKIGDVKKTERMSESAKCTLKSNSYLGDPSHFLSCNQSNKTYSIKLNPGRTLLVVS